MYSLVDFIYIVMVKQTNILMYVKITFNNILTPHFPCDSSRV